LTVYYIATHAQISTVNLYQIIIIRRTEGQ